jgi:cytochrome c2
VQIVRNGSNTGVERRKMKDLSRRQLRHFVAAAALAVAAISVVVGNAFGGGAASVTGAKIFVSSGCGGCHTFKAAAAKGTIGPNLDKVILTKAKLETAISKGGAAVMTPAQLKKYKFKMVPFAGKLSPSKIATLAGFLLADRNKAPAPGTTTTPSKTGGGGGTTTTTPAGGGGGGGGGTTTTTPAGGGGGTDTIDGCPAGKTIPTSGNTDGDDDDTGGQTDGDGCI